MHYHDSTRRLIELYVARPLFVMIMVWLFLVAVVPTQNVTRLAYSQTAGYSSPVYSSTEQSTKSESKQSSAKSVPHQKAVSNSGNSVVYAVTSDSANYYKGF